MKTFLTFLAALGSPAYGFLPSRLRAAAPQTVAYALERREWLSATSAAALLGAVSPANAVVGGVPVGEGGMPSGARQFAAVVRAQKDWAAVATRVKSGEASDEEWKNIQLYLRKLYSVGDDMTSMAKGLPGSSQASALELIKDFKNVVKESDPLVVAKNVDGFLAVQNKTAKQLDDFLAFFQDVPDL